MLMICLMILSGDEERDYFLRLHTAFEKNMYGVALSMLRDKGAAEEAVQDSWVRVAVSFKKIFDLEWDTIEGYLVILVRNVCKNRIRYQKEHPTSEFPEDWDAPDPAEQCSTVLWRIVTLIRSMPLAYREILEMKFVLEYTNREIGRRLEINESTVASRVARGRTLLIEALRKEGYGVEE